jgi:putative phosphoribosyl transferase
MSVTSTATPWPVQIPERDAILSGDLSVPDTPRGVVVFAHGGGSGRHSTRNIAVAQALQHEGFATLLLDLLTPDEDRSDAVTAEFRFDIPLLGQRVIAAIDWALGDPRTAALPIGVFGAGTGAAAALVGAARRPQAVRGVISCGGRPDLVGPLIATVRAPMLLIVGGLDDVVIELNREALARATGPASLEIVPGATHLFDEPGTLDQVVQLAIDWLDRHLPHE